MSSPIATTLYALNEFSASAVTTHSAFLLSNGQELIRKFNVPNGWTSIRVNFKFTLYSPTTLPQSDLPSSRMIAAVCSDGRNIGNLSQAHCAGVYFGIDGMSATNFVVNGNAGAGFSSGSYNTNVTNPPGCAWQVSPYVSRAFSYATGSLQFDGQGTSGHFLPLYNTQWSSSYTSSNGYPLYQLAGYAWRNYSILFTKNQALSGSSVSVTQRSLSGYSSVGITGVPGIGLNTPRIITRRAAMNDTPSVAFANYNAWEIWFKDLTKDTLIGTYALNDPGAMRIDEQTYGPLNCIDLQWITAADTQLAIRDVFIVVLQ